jgi:hypothetical protein
MKRSTRILIFLGIAITFICVLVKLIEFIFTGENLLYSSTAPLAVLLFIIMVVYSVIGAVMFYELMFIENLKEYQVQEETTYRMTIPIKVQFNVQQNRNNHLIGKSGWFTVKTFEHEAQAKAHKYFLIHGEYEADREISTKTKVIG